MFLLYRLYPCVPISGSLHLLFWNPAGICSLSGWFLSLLSVLTAMSSPCRFSWGAVRGGAHLTERHPLYLQSPVYLHNSNTWIIKILIVRLSEKNHKRGKENRKNSRYKWQISKELLYDPGDSFVLTSIFWTYCFQKDRRSYDHRSQSIPTAVVNGLWGRPPGLGILSRLNCYCDYKYFIL